jgi:hypothetical protein
MTINYNSFSSKLYRWFYGTIEMPNNLCPYFWKLFIAFVLAIPLFVLTLPFEILRVFSKHRREDFYDISIWTRLLSTMAFIVIILCAAALIAPISLFFGYEAKPDSFIESLIWAGAFVWIIALSFALVGLIDFVKNKYHSFKRNGKTIKVKTDNIVLEFAKAKYNKYCPKIEWKGRNSETEVIDQ